jgi:hypothetical protein
MGTMTKAERAAATPDARSLRLARRLIADYERYRTRPRTPDAIVARLRLEQFVRGRGDLVSTNGMQYRWSHAEGTLIRTDLDAAGLGGAGLVRV